MIGFPLNIGLLQCDSMNVELDAGKKEELDPVLTSKIVPYSYNASHVLTPLGQREFVQILYRS